ncbi:MAG TPA: TonB-dependent receptor [Terriglobia bacterium]|nr:TonB-dependent receptor [Terriglobia bacterium]
MRERIPDRKYISGFVAWVAASAMLPVLVLLTLGLPMAAARAAPPAQQPVNGQTLVELHAAVVDENGAAVPSARITLTPPLGTPLHGETDYAGRKEFSGLVPGDYSLQVEKEGFFAITQPGIQVGEVASAEVVLHHIREFSEQVNVVYSPPAIDPAKTQASETLSSEQIIDLPYPVSRDVRYGLPMLPGVLQDSTGQLHVDGASTRQVYDQIDGFNVSDPATGQFLTRISVDALRSVEVANSRYSTQFGKSSGGVISLHTGTGDDHWRVTGTDPFPGLGARRGLHLNNWTPRGILSGPIRTGKAWFMDAAELEYDQVIYTELPANADRYAVMRGSNISKVQINLAQNNNLTVSLLVNSLDSPHAGLDPLDPISTTQRYSTNAYLFNAKDQHLFQNGTLLEAGVATASFYTRVVPMGAQTYVITPNGTSGNYYLTNHGQGGRTEAIGNLFLPPLHAAGKHEFKLGVDFDRLDDHQDFNRQPYVVERDNGTLSRRVSFTHAPPFTRYDVEEGGYAQDRWSITPRWLLEPGVRFDADEIVRGVAASPRLASTFMLKRNGESKISAGLGVYRDPSNLDILTRSLTGTRTDSFYDPSGRNLLQPPVLSTLSIHPDQLRFSFVTNASVAFEQKLPRTTYLHLELGDRRARDIWTFINPGASTLPDGPFSGQFILTNARRDHYDSATLTLRHVFKQNHEVFASYTRSRALTNADFGYNLDSVLFSPQAGGPLAWDAPNRFLSHGWIPLAHKIDAAYTLDWRTGFPFTLQNDSEEVVGAPYSQRFPTYFSLDVSLERRFTVVGFQWALRAGVDNVTKHSNYSFVNSNIDSPDFHAYAGAPGRSFIARIRLLGRK